MSDKTDPADPAIDPIEAFIWLFAGLSSSDSDTRKALDLTKRIRLGISSDENQILERACREALKNYQRKMMGQL